MEHNFKKLPIIKRMLLRLLLWTLKDSEESQTHPINAVIYNRSHDGRIMVSAKHPQVILGDYSYGFRRESFFAYHPDDRVKIGKFCSIADGVRFVFGEHRIDGVTTFPLKAICFSDCPHADALSKGQINIGNDVWISVNSIILSGVTIGDGAVIAAGAVVNQNVPPYAVVGGVPAKLLKFRLNSDQIDSLLRIQWWNWPITKIEDNLELFYSDVDQFISVHDPIKKTEKVT